MSGTTVQYPGDTIDGLLDNGRVDALTDGVRVRRAMSSGNDAITASAYTALDEIGAHPFFGACFRHRFAGSNRTADAREGRVGDLHEDYR